MNTVTGTVKDILTQGGESNGKEWVRTTVVVETTSKFNNLVPISFFNETIPTKVGDEVSVDFYVGGREYQGKYYAQLDGNKIEVTGPPQTPSKATTKSDEPAPIIGEDEDDLPF